MAITLGNIDPEQDLIRTMVNEIRRQIAPMEMFDREKLKAQNQKLILPLAHFVEATSNLVLDPWQLHLCSRLEKLVYQKGQRILLHAMPQAGKSFIVSQRLPAYLLGHNPWKREKLACYNIDHSTRFGKVVKELMQSAEYRSIFPDPRLRIPQRAADAEWSTAARTKLRDAQPSFKCLGLQTGFVGQGAEDLTIDDPYASPQDAASVAIRESTWMFWNESAKVRLNEESNVVVMFHRYNEDDLAGRMIREDGLQSEGGAWELIRYAAIWDGDERPEVGGPDPLGRAVGEKLSPRFSEAFLEKQKKQTWVWLGQFQGKPTNKEGGFFRVGNFGVVDELHGRVTFACRAWDKASTQDDGDYTVGALLLLMSTGRIVVADVVRGQWDTDQRDRIIKSTTQRDHALARTKWRCEYLVRGMQDPGSAGKDDAKAFVKMLRGFTVKVETVSGDKATNADPYSSYVNAGMVDMLTESQAREPWHLDFREEHRVFPRGLHEDIIDACSHAFKELTLADMFEAVEQMSYAGISGRESLDDRMDRTLNPEKRSILLPEDVLLEQLMLEQEMGTNDEDSDNNFYTSETEEKLVATGLLVQSGKPRIEPGLSRRTGAERRIRYTQANRA